MTYKIPSLVVQPADADLNYIYTLESGDEISELVDLPTGTAVRIHTLDKHQTKLHQVVISVFDTISGLEVGFSFNVDAWSDPITDLIIVKPLSDIIYTINDPPLIVPLPEYLRKPSDALYQMDY